MDGVELAAERERVGKRGIFFDDDAPDEERIDGLRVTAGIRHLVKSEDLFRAMYNGLSLYW